MNDFITCFSRPAVLAISIVFCTAGRGDAQPATSGGGATPTVIYADQGWSDTDRDTFYMTSQGSALIQYSWFKALRRLEVDEPFAGDRLQRYGYLPNEHPRKNLEDLPIGFVVNGNLISGDLGMTCAACHTGQLEYQREGVNYALRLDGAPAKADFQAFVADLTDAARATLDQPDRFRAFAKSVLGVRYSASEANQLRTNFEAWTNEFEDFMKRSLPETRWGPGRLDAFGMIFNRVAGRDLGITYNFAVADAPVRYPFLWNASRQDRTQWNGGVPNGLYVQALGRNTGEALGVFARFKPRLVGPHLPLLPPPISYNNNSVDFMGLQALEEKIVKLRPPPWPADIDDRFHVDEPLAKRGEELFGQHCKSCHTDEPSAQVIDAWKTPVVAVGTDPKMAQNAGRRVDTGNLAGAVVPRLPFDTALERNAKASDVLAVAVAGILSNQLIVEALHPNEDGMRRALNQDIAKALPGQKLDPKKIKQDMEFVNKYLDGLFSAPPVDAGGAAYEARALHGIWAAAPYLHNGSVPNLWELLKPAKERMPSFMVGSRMFDPKQVGYVTEQSPFKGAKFEADSTKGNGNAGHEYGTDLSLDDRWAIIEYLKKL
jgi:mono/diheme cytochrome c family protein